MAQDRDARDANGKPVLKLKVEWVRRQFRQELQTLQLQGVLSAIVRD